MVRNEHQRQYYLDNKEKILNQQLEYKICNKERVLTYQRKYYHEHPELFKQYCNNMTEEQKERKRIRDRKSSELLRIRQGHVPKYLRTEEDKQARKIKSKEKRAIVLRRCNLKRYFNITIEQYNALFIEQEGRCLICGRHQSEFKKSLAVDHDHKTGKIRGLLCTKCNPVLGYVDEDISILENIIKYLKENK